MSTTPNGAGDSPASRLHRTRTEEEAAACRPYSEAIMQDIYKCLLPDHIAWERLRPAIEGRLLSLRLETVLEGLRRTEATLALAREALEKGREQGRTTTKPERTLGAGGSDAASPQDEQASVEAAQEGRTAEGSGAV